MFYSCPGPLGCRCMGGSGQWYLILITYTASTWWYSIDDFNNSSTLDRCMNAHVLLLLQITLYPHIAIFRVNSGLGIINSITNQICRNYLLLYIPWTVHERPSSTLLHGISASYLSPTYFIINEIVSQLSEPPVLVLPLRCSFRYDLHTHKRDRQISGQDSASMDLLESWAGNVPFARVTLAMGVYFWQNSIAKVVFSLAKGPF